LDDDDATPGTNLEADSLHEDTRGRPENRSNQGTFNAETLDRPSSEEQIAHSKYSRAGAEDRQFSCGPRFDFRDLAPIFVRAIARMRFVVLIARELAEHVDKPGVTVR
jgi:hypothetical protein